MKAFFDKHGGKLTEGVAIDMMIKELQDAKACIEDDEDYLYHLAYAHELIEDFFQIKSTAPQKHKKPLG